MKALFHSTFLQRVCSCLLLLGLLFAFPLNVSAADGTENIDVADMTLKGEIWYLDQEEPDDVTSDMSIGSTGNYYRINLPIADTSKSRILVGITLTELFDFNSEHEYSLSFQWKSNIDKGMHCYVSLVYYDNDGNELKVQDLVNQYDSTNSGGYNTVDISFKPDTSGLSGGYNCDLRIYFMQNGWDGTSTTQAVLISKEIELIDKDDDSGWFQKILNKINDVWESIKALPDKIDASFQAVGDKISAAFEAVAGDILEGIKEVLEWAFVPSDDFLNNIIDEWQVFFNDHFGIFAQASNFLIDMLQYFDDLFSNEYSFVFPEVSVPIMGKDIVIIEEQKVDMAQWLESGSFGARLYEIYTTCVWAIVIFCILKYALVVQDVFFAGYRMVLNTV